MISTSMDCSFPTFPVLLVNEVHVWCAALDTEPEELSRLEQALAPDERARATQFHFAKDRKRFVARRGLLREILAHYLGRRPGQLRFACGLHGKPRLLHGPGPHEVHFNLAHSQDLALYVFAREREVGIDVERINPDLVDQQVAELFFSRRESSALRALPASLRVEAFFNCWTRKEAYVKARGEGLLASLSSFDVSLTPGEPAEVLSGGDGQWLMYALTPELGYTAAVVVEGHDSNLRLRKWRAMTRAARSQQRRPTNPNEDGFCQFEVTPDPSACKKGVSKTRLHCRS
jgi:4'-phosphopantetheinyl transferase